MKIGIITVGGDCSGLNSIIYGAYKTCKKNGHQLIGFLNGIRGLHNNNILELNDTICNEELLFKSGSILRTDNRYVHRLLDNGQSIEDIYNKMFASYKQNQLDGLIDIGGDGSLSIAKDCITKYDAPFNVVFIPKTIDNDVYLTDYAIGFKTAVQNAVNLIRNIRSTMMSHERVAVVEVMGRNAGFLAMYAGVASGADVILVPEIPYSFDNLMHKVKSCYDGVKNHCIIVVSEAVVIDGLSHNSKNTAINETYKHITYNGIGKVLADKISAEGYDVKSVTLGHSQRGGDSVIDDTINSVILGTNAVNMIEAGDVSKVLCMKNNMIETIDIRSVDAVMKKCLSKDDDIVVAANNMCIYCGEI